VRGGFARLAPPSRRKELRDIIFFDTVGYAQQRSAACRILLRSSRIVARRNTGLGPQFDRSQRVIRDIIRTWRDRLDLSYEPSLDRNRADQVAVAFRTRCLSRNSLPLCSWAGTGLLATSRRILSHAP
jgi:hypothetical protein